MSEKKWVGEKINRKEDLRFVTGHGKFTDDISLPGMLHCAMLRSPYGHAKIKSIDYSRAKVLPGVRAVITGEEAKKYWGPLAPAINIDMKVPTVYPLAVDKVYYMGEPVVAVAAETRYIAEDALDLIEVEYEPLPVVVDMEKALEHDSPLLYPEWGDNIQCDWGMSIGPVDEVFAKADYIFEERIPHHRYTAVSMEGRAALASFEPYNNKLTLWCSTQSPTVVRTLVAQSFNFPEQNVQVICPDVGGGFGPKLQANAEVIPCLLTMITGKPVKWTESRQENLLAGIQERDYIWYVKAAVKKDGTLLGLKGLLLGDTGCDGTCHAAGAGKFLVAASYLPGPYKMEAFEVRTKVIVTNKAPTGAYRGYGKDMANYPLERLLNRIAKELGISPVDLRIRNFIKPDEFPYQQISGPVYDSGNYEELLKKTLALIKYDEVKERQAKENGKNGKYIGIGVASMVEPSGGAVPNCIFNSYEVVTIRMMPEGGFQVLTGHQNIGQGIETTLAQVVAQEMGCTPEDVTVIFGDTTTVPYGLGPWSSRGATFNVSCVVEAARKLKDNMEKIAANVWQCDQSQIEIYDNNIYCKTDKNKKMTFKQFGVMTYLYPGAMGVVPSSVTSLLEATHFWLSPISSWIPDELGRIKLYTTHPCASSAAVVEVDINTGKIKILDIVVGDDCGVMINPTIVNGQVHGGTIQGVGGALWEELYYDENGQLLNTDLTSYLHPLAADVPDVRVTHMESPSPYTALGSKGMGEGSAILPASVLANAVEDALKSFNVKVSDLPLKPERVLKLIKNSMQG